MSGAEISRSGGPRCIWRTGQSLVDNQVRRDAIAATSAQLADASLKAGTRRSGVRTRRARTKGCADSCSRPRASSFFLVAGGRSGKTSCISRSAGPSGAVDKPLSADRIWAILAVSSRARSAMTRRMSGSARRSTVSLPSRAEYRVAATSELPSWLPSANSAAPRTVAVTGGNSRAYVVPAAIRGRSGWNNSRCSLRGCGYHYHRRMQIPRRPLGPVVQSQFVHCSVLIQDADLDGRRLADKGGGLKVSGADSSRLLHAEPASAIAAHIKSPPYRWSVMCASGLSITLVTSRSKLEPREGNGFRPRSGRKNRHFGEWPTAFAVPYRNRCPERVLCAHWAGDSPD